MKVKILTTLIFAAFGLIIFNSNPHKVEAAIRTWVGTNGNWDNPSNWSSGVPTSTDTVRIPTSRSTVNNIVGLDIDALIFTGSTPGGTLSGNNLTINSLINSNIPITISLDITLGDNIGISTNNYNGAIDLNGHNLVVVASSAPWGIAGPVNGSGTIDASSTGNIFFTGGAGAGGKVINASGNTDVYLSGAGWDNATTLHLTSGASFSGPGGSVDRVDTDGTATISPSRGGTISTTQMVLGPSGIGFTPGDTITLTIAGTTLGTNYDSIQSNSATIDLSGVTLSLNLDSGYSAPAGDSFTILESSAGITGEFNGAPDGSIITAGGRPFQIRYLGTTVELLVPSIGLSNPTFVSNPVIPTAGQPFTITSVWLGLGPTATGTAELFNGATSLGTVALVGGVATFNVAGLPQGDYSFTVGYSGDINFAAAASSPLILTVAAALADTGIHLPLHLIVFSLLLTLFGFVLIKRNLK